jgi:hypothetical protein
MVDGPGVGGYVRPDVERLAPARRPRVHFRREVSGRELQPLFDEVRKDLGSIYAMVLHVNGYLAIHHADASEPLTGIQS